MALLRGVAAAETAPMPATLVGWARKLVSEVEPARNVYASDPTYVEWTNAATGAAARNRSVCSSFARHDGTLAGYAWSDFVKSRFHPVEERAIVIGRLDPSTVPHPSGMTGTESSTADEGVSADATGSSE